MFKRLLAAAVLIGALFALSTPATATCQPGRIGWHNGKPVIQLPQCDPLPE